MTRNQRVPAPELAPDSPPVIEIRLSGQPEDVTRASVIIAELDRLNVLKISGPRPNRHDPGVRVYIFAELTGGQ